MSTNMKPSQERARRLELAALPKAQLVKVVMKFNGRTRGELNTYPEKLLIDMIVSREKR